MNTNPNTSRANGNALPLHGGPRSPLRAAARGIGWFLPACGAPGTARPTGARNKVAKVQGLGALLLTVLTISLSGGCASTTGGGGYELKQTRNDVDWAMTRYHTRLSFGFITTAQQDQVTAAYKAYQTAFNEAVQQAHSNYNAPTPDNVKQLADRLLGLLAAIP